MELVDLLQICMVDALTSGNGSRRFTRDFIGAGPWTVASLIASLTSNRVTCRIFRAEDFLNKVDSLLGNYDCLLISAMTMDKPACQKVIQKWRQTHKGPIAIGGPICCEPGIKERLHVDLAISGELELHLPEMVRFLNNCARIVTKSELIPNLEQMSPQDFAEFHRDPDFIFQYPDFQHARIYVECVRGCSNYRRPKLKVKCPSDCHRCDSSGVDLTNACPQKIPPGCGYCGTHAMFGPPKSRAVASIIREALNLISLGATRLVLGGPDLLDFQREQTIVPTPLTWPTAPPEVNYPALRSLISTLAGLPEVQNGIIQVFYENLKGSLCTEETLRILREIPNPIFSIGVETGDAAHATLLGRPDNPEECLAAIKRAKQMGFRVHAYFIHSLPGESPKTVKNTLILLQKLKQLDIEKITLYQFKALPGTYFEHFHQSKQQQKIMRPWIEKIKKFAIQYNNAQKDKYVGQVLTVDLVEQHKFRPGTTIGRLLSGGPAVEIEDSAQFIGQRKQVKVTGVVSDRLLKGRLLNN